MRRTLVILTLAAVAAGFVLLATRTQNEVRVAEQEGISDETKAAIVSAILAEVKPDDYAIADGSALYVYLPDEIYARLPKEINGVSIKQLTIRQYSDGFDKPYLVFPNWEEANGIVTVANVAFFPAGNSGGCMYNFGTEDGKWLERSRKCYATAR